MWRDEEERLPLALAPINFFEIRVKAPYHGGKALSSLTAKEGKAFCLPDLSFLTSDESFGAVGLGWNEEGILIRAEIDKPFEAAFFPDVMEGDSLEIFIDTRDVKTSGFATRFCHHFVFLAEETDGKFGAEISRFRQEDSHPLCDHNDLIVKPKRTKNSYCLDIFIPASCLFGYDIAEFNRIGFTYRINRCGGLPQHFTVRSDDYRIEDQPSLWASVQLER